jgi:hypothetical protein
VNALAPLAAPTSTTNTEVEISLFNMLVLLSLRLARCLPIQREQSEVSCNQALTWKKLWRTTAGVNAGQRVQMKDLQRTVRQKPDTTARSAQAGHYLR